MSKQSNIAPIAPASSVVAAVVAAVGLDELCWYGQYAKPSAAAFYRGGDRRRARRIEAALASAGIPPAILKESHYMGFYTV